MTFTPFLAWRALKSGPDRWLPVRVPRRLPPGGRVPLARVLLPAQDGGAQVSTRTAWFVIAPGVSAEYEFDDFEFREAWERKAE
ncbi:hypothetical protein SMICM304S_11452 [Streptomyces microflavus]